jgi:hypothetical protein
VDRDVELLGRLAQPAKKNAVVTRIVKYQLAIIAALDDVVGLLRDDEAGKAGHISKRLANTASVAN